MPETLASAAKTLNFGRAPAGLGPQMRWLLRTVIPAIGRALGVKISIQGAESASMQADGGMSFKVSAGSSASDPFLCPDTTDGSTASVIVGGNVNGVTVTNLSLTISATGTKYVYIDVTYTQSLSANDYVLGFSGAITAALATGSSVPSDTSTHLYRQVATYVNGTKTVQAIETSMQVEARDNGAGAHVTRAIWGRA